MFGVRRGPSPIKQEDLCRYPAVGYPISEPRKLENQSKVIETQHGHILLVPLQRKETAMEEFRAAVIKSRGTWTARVEEKSFEGEKYVAFFARTDVDPA